MQIIVSGSLAHDQIMNFPEAFNDHIMPDKLHVMSVSFLVNHLQKNFGGTAGNISYNLGILGESPICIATLGKDAQEYIELLKKHGVNVAYIQQLENDYTSSFVVITDIKDCQIAGFYPGAMQKDVDLSIEPILKEQKLQASDVFWVIAPTDTKAMAKFVKQAHELGIRYLYSPAQQIPQLTKEELLEGISKAEILIGNDYELALLEKKIGLSKEEILSQVKIMITTLNDRGSMIEQTGKEETMIGVAKPRALKDPTGVGDAYIAGFLSRYLKEKSLAECGQAGAIAATYVLEEYGTTSHSYTLDLFQNRLKENFG
ncbi:carbohydrate kinase family protein [Candidatus Beckwithbacteria bacterium]|nr:carbohydrate kinase family protein [Candidatus Beckwithbacteria bacterium]